MSLLYIVLPSAAILTVAYFTYGRLLAHLFRLNPDAKTPAHELSDGIDFEPIAPSSLLPQHFSAIAAAGPIVGPIVAGLAFGWLPALIWIIVGSIFIGGVHDFTSLVASIRHKARSIAEVVREHMTRRSYLLFLTFIWIALIYIIVAFTDITALAFLAQPSEETGGVGGGAVTTSSVLYLLITFGMGYLMRYTNINRTVLLWSCLALVAGAIYLGTRMPFDLGATLDLSPANARRVWNTLLLVYCLAAGVVPVWLLLQPRGELGGYFLYAALGAGALGLMFGCGTAQYPAFRGWEVTQDNGVVMSIFPLLFITIACGACSGFHSLIASGTTSKQLRKETDAKLIGYGAMLMEAMVAIVSLSCVMMFAQGSPQLDPNKPNMVYAQGIGEFAFLLSKSQEVRALGIAFALMAFTTFVYDTLDVCTRLGRFIIQELSGMHGLAGRWLGTALTAGIPLFFLLNQSSAPGAPPIWRVFWSLFGASNQLLAALTLLGITVWLWQTRREWWVWVVTGIPTVFMYIMSTWALISITLPKFMGKTGWILPTDPVPWIGLILLGLALLMLVEAAIVLLALGTPPSPKPKAAFAT